MVLERAMSVRMQRSQLIRSFNVPARRLFTSTTRDRNVVEQSDFLEQFLQGQKPDQSTIDHFSSMGWTRKYFDDRRYEAIPFYSRYIKEPTGENRFFSGIVNTQGTIPHVLAFRLKNIQTPEPSTNFESSPSLSDDAQPLSEVVCLMSLGRDLEAHPMIVHGGFQGVIFDEIMRLVILLHQNKISQVGPRLFHYTLNMSTTFHGPVQAPSHVIATSRLVERRGRRWLLEANILSTDARLLTSSNSTWVTAKQRLAFGDK